MRAFDEKATIEYSIPSVVLMENAALRVVEFLEWKFGDLREKRVVVLCGKGNNGGDGFVIARHLASAGCFVRVLKLYEESEFSDDALLNYKIIAQDEANGPDYFQLDIDDVDDMTRPEFFGAVDIGIDAWLGTGFRGDLPETAAELLRVAQVRVAVDIPSGLNAETGKAATNSVKADYTITFAAPKTGMFLRDGMENCGEIWVGDIGTAHNQMRATATDCEAITRETAHRLLPIRPIDAHKGTVGKVIVVGGSRGMSGAPVLASRAALRVGAGLCIACVPDRVLDVFAASFLEATSRALPCDDEGRLVPDAADLLPEIWKNADVVALGPGLSRSAGALEFARRIVRECARPLVIDADALGALRAIADDVKARNAPTILTPHPGEMGDLMETETKIVNENRLKIARECAQKFNAIVVLKGARSIVAAPNGQIWFNLTGNAGMATGGSGDVLTGTIAGLLAQMRGVVPIEDTDLEDAQDTTRENALNANALNTTLLGVFLHGLAGDIEYSIRGNGLLASDIADALPAAILDLQASPQAEAINGRLRKLE